MHALDEHQAVQLLDALTGTQLGAPTAVALMTGLRRGELLALRWTDVDVNAATLSVRRSLEMVNGAPHFKEPKTAKSRRVLSLPVQAVAVLKTHRVEQSKMRLALGAGWNDAGLVFPDLNGEPWAPDKFSSAFYYKIRTMKLPAISFHGLRHSFASIALRSGTPLNVMSEALGHTTIGVTADIYTHVLDDTKREAADKLGSILQSARLTNLG